MATPTMLSGFSPDRPVITDMIEGQESNSPLSAAEAAPAVLLHNIELDTHCSLAFGF